MRDSAWSIGSPSSFIPSEFQEIVDVADCALDEHLERLQRKYAAASRAVARSAHELGQLERRDDVNPNVLSQLRRQLAAAETRSQQLLRVIDALEDRTLGSWEND